MEQNELMSTLVARIAERGATKQSDFAVDHPSVNVDQIKEAARTLQQRGIITSDKKKNPTYSLASLQDLASLVLDLSDKEAQDRKKGAIAKAFFDETKKRNELEASLGKAKERVKKIKGMLKRSNERLEQWGNGEVPELSATEEFKGASMLELPFNSEPETGEVEEDAELDAERPDFDSKDEAPAPASAQAPDFALPTTL